MAASMRCGARLRPASLVRAVVAAAIVGSAMAIPTIPKAGSMPPITVPFNSSLRTGSDDLDPNDPSIRPPYDPSEPDQIHMQHYGDGELLVSWVTGRARAGPGSVPEPGEEEVSGPEGESVVEFGRSAGDLRQVARAPRATTYSYRYYGFPDAWNYTSGAMHHVLLQGLTPLSTYYYRVGTAGRWSAVHAVEVPPRRGDAGGPLRLGVMADVGQTYNSSDTLHHMLDDAPHAILLVGDLSYADDYQSNGSLDPWLVPNATVDTPPGEQYPEWGTFQPRWDDWGRLAQPLQSGIPHLFNNGNHEIERQSDGSTEFASYAARYPPPYEASGSPSPLFYSTDVGPVHVVFLTSYTPYERGSEQYRWLHADLQSVDRSITPWLLVTLHAPLYNSYTAHYQENECMRLEVEPLLYAFGVDLVLSGHVHAYERTQPVYNNTVDECGPVYLTIGDGGNIERLAITFVDEPDGCPNPDEPAPEYQPEKCVTYQEGRYCPDQQPHWSAFREPSFGHGILTVHGRERATWQWNRNEEPNRVVADHVELVQQSDLSQRCAAARGEALLAHHAGYSDSQGAEGPSTAAADAKA